MARNKSNMDRDTLTHVGNDDTLTIQCDDTGTHKDIVGTNARVDTLMPVVIA